MRVTRYDRVSALLMAVVAGLVISVAWLSVVWAANRRPPRRQPAPLELVDVSGGDEEGFIDETLRLDTPQYVADDPSLAEAPADQSEIAEMLENVVELADEATNQAQQQLALESENVGKPGSATGTGRRALGMGAGHSGLPRDQRWFIRFSDRETLVQYARQLDFFEIELAVLAPQGELIFISQLSAAQPRVRRINSGKDETRLYMTWQGGDRRVADLALFQKAGIDVGSGLIMQFYPAKTEALLAQQERDYRNRPADQIRRTYFVVNESGEGYKFVVTRQTYFR
jgi:hypothetical protein